MSHRTRILVLVSGLVLGADPCLSSAPTSAVQAVRTISLYRSPEPGVATAELQAGSEFEVIERRGDWVRVRVEGWVLDAERALLETPPGSTPTESTRSGALAGASAAVGVQGRARLEGTLRLKARSLRRETVAGTQVLVLPADADIAAVDPPEEARRLAELDHEIDSLENQAQRALQQDSFSKATAEHDAIKARVRRSIGERRALHAARQGRHASRAQALAVAVTTCDARGWFTVPGAPAGDWRVYIRLATKDEDLEWLVPLRLVDGETTQLDLDETRSSGSLRGSDR